MICLQSKDIYRYCYRCDTWISPPLLKSRKHKLYDKLYPTLFAKELTNEINN